MDDDEGSLSQPAALAGPHFQIQIDSSLLQFAAIHLWVKVFLLLTSNSPNNQKRVAS